MRFLNILIALAAVAVAAPADKRQVCRSIYHKGNSNFLYEHGKLTKMLKQYDCIVCASSTHTIYTELYNMGQRVGNLELMNITT